MFERIKSKASIIGTYMVDENGELSAQGKEMISVDVASTNVNVYTHDRDSVKAHLYGEVKATSEDIVPCLELEENGQGIAVSVKYLQAGKRFFRYFSDNLRLDVTIPESWINKLDIRSASGNISAQTLSGSDVALKSSSGDIKIQYITGYYIAAETVSGNIDAGKLSGEKGFIKSSSGDLNIKEAVFSDKLEVNTVSGKCHIDKLECKEGRLAAGSGDIETKDVVAEKVKSETVSGSIKIKMRNGSADLNVTSGNIRAEFEENFELINAKSASGNINLALPSGSEFTMNVKTVTGVIKCNDIPVKISSSDGRHLEGKVGNGSGEVNISTTSGNVTIREY